MLLLYRPFKLDLEIAIEYLVSHYAVTLSDYDVLTADDSYFQYAEPC